MDRFVIKDDLCFELNCSLCSRQDDCDRLPFEDSTNLCFLELKERLYKYECEAAELESKIEKLKSNPVLGKFLK